MKSWTNGKIVDGKIPIDSFNYALHYAGPCVWEGMRSYIQEDGTCKIWKLSEHIQRLHDSAKIMGFSLPYTAGQIEQACKDVVQANGNKDFYLRPVAYNAVDADGIHSAKEKINVDIYCLPVPTLHANPDKGIKVGISNLNRGYPQYQMQVKTPGNYHMLSQLRVQMKQLGTDDMFLVDNNGYITEASVANFFLIKGDVIMTPPNDGSILPGITRHSIAAILSNKPLMVTKFQRNPTLIEKHITKADLYTADCVILCGTYAEVVLVREIDGRVIGEGEDHFYYKMLKSEYAKAVRGRTK